MKFLFSLFFVGSSAMAAVQPMSVQQARDLLAAPIPAAVEQSLQKTPREYSFFNDQGENSVAYVGQVIRQVLINDIKLAFGSLEYGSFAEDQVEVPLARLNSYYRYNYQVDGPKPFFVKAVNEDGVETFFWEGSTYDSIFPRAVNLYDKMAGVDNPLRRPGLIGWKSSEIGGVTIDQDKDGFFSPNEFIEAMMLATANNAASSNTEIAVDNGMGGTESVTKAAVLANGLDLSQMAQKFLHGAISLSQASGDYLSADLDPSQGKGFHGENDQLYQTRPYTLLQHFWDEAYGYFGPARNYLDYTDQQVSDGISLDAYFSEDVEDPSNGQILYTQQEYGQGDGDISISGEKNLGLAVNAAKRDLGAKLQNEDFTFKTMTAFLKGRQLVQDRPEGYLPYAQAYGMIAMHEWERVVAATVVHYINKTVKDYKAFGTDQYSYADFAKHYSELKGFALTFQFNPTSAFFMAADGTTSDAKFIEMHDLIGDVPPQPGSQSVESYIENLLQARQILQEVYEFDTANVEAW